MGQKLGIFNPFNCNSETKHTYSIDKTNIVYYDGLSIKDHDALLGATYNNTPAFGLKNFRGWCKGVRVYDGDTVHVAAIIDGSIKRIKCRLSNIDAAEMKTKNIAELAHAKIGKKRMEELILNKIVWIHIKGNDKYGGRYVATFYPDQKEDTNKSFNQTMLIEGLAYEYNGKKKKKFTDWHKK